VLEAVGKRKLRELQRCVVAVLLENMALDEPHADLAAYVGRHLAHHVRGALQPEVSLLRDEALLQPLLHHPRAAVRLAFAQGFGAEALRHAAALAESDGAALQAAELWMAAS